MKRPRRRVFDCRFKYKGLSKSDTKNLSNAFVDSRLDSQTETIAEQLGDFGFVSNFAAIDGDYDEKILRLGAIIFRLRREFSVHLTTYRGYEIPGCPSPLQKNTYYLVGERSKKAAAGNLYKEVFA